MLIASLTREHPLHAPMFCPGELQDEAHRRLLASCSHATMLRIRDGFRLRVGP
jgi:hypothetical protein